MVRRRAAASTRCVNKLLTMFPGGGDGCGNSRAVIIAELDTLRSARSGSTAAIKWSLRQKLAIPQTGFDNRKEDCSVSLVFPRPLTHMSFPTVGRTARRGAAAMHLPVRMNSSAGLAKDQKPNVRRVQIRHSERLMTCRSSVIYAGPTRMVLRSIFRRLPFFLQCRFWSAWLRNAALAISQLVTRYWVRAICFPARWSHRAALATR